MAPLISHRAPVPVHLNVDSWVEENEKYFVPPVCNKMMHNTQLKVFFVGGPNVRKDYHLEEGEELFYMRKGNMCLKIQEGGKFKDVHIKEGQVFLLPGKIPHSPQRQAKTVGLVIERERLLEEKDGLRYFVEGSGESLYERWFYCDDLGTQLGPVIKGFFASEQCKTGKPIPGDNPAPAWIPDSERRVEDPFNLKDWLKSNRSAIASADDGVRLFAADRYQTDVVVMGKAASGLKADGGETMLWQLQGRAKVSIKGRGEFTLTSDEMLLVPEGEEFDFDPSGNDPAACMAVTMNPANKDRIARKA